jgi:heat shock protein HslJ
MALFAIFTGAVYAQKTTGDLSSTRWHLVQIGGEKIKNSKAFIEFNESEKRFAGNAGCNRMFGEFETSGGEIKFSGVGTTKMFCGDAGAMKTEAAFTRALSEATAFKKKGGALKLFAGDRLLAKFKASEKNDSEKGETVKLEDKKWILSEIKDKPIVESKETPIITFDKENSAGGYTGCNVFVGNYSVKGEKIKITEIMSTFRACVEVGNMTVEREFLSGLQKANRLLIKDGKLFLYEDEDILLAFRPENE